MARVVIVCTMLAVVTATAFIIIAQRRHWFIRPCPKCGRYPQVEPGINPYKGSGWCVWHPSCQGSVSAKFKWLAILRWNRWCKKPTIISPDWVIEAAAAATRMSASAGISFREFTECMEATCRRLKDD